MKVIPLTTKETEDLVSKKAAVDALNAELVLAASALQTQQNVILATYKLNVGVPPKWSDDYKYLICE